MVVTMDTINTNTVADLYWGLPAPANRWTQELPGELLCEQVTEHCPPALHLRAGVGATQNLPFRAQMTAVRSLSI